MKGRRITYRSKAEKRGIAKALRAAGMKFSVVRKRKAKRNPSRRRRNEWKGLPFTVRYITITGKKKTVTVTAHSREEAMELARRKKRVPRLSLITGAALKKGWKPTQ